MKTLSSPRLDPRLEALYGDYGMDPGLAYLARQGSAVTPGWGRADARVVVLLNLPSQQAAEGKHPLPENDWRFLRRVLEEVGVEADDVFFTYVVKYHLPDGQAAALRGRWRTEIRHSHLYVRKEMQIVQPDVIVPMGREAIHYCIPGGRVSALHGRPHRLRRAVVLPTYHPRLAMLQIAYAATIEQDLAPLRVLLADGTEMLPRG